MYSEFNTPANILINDYNFTAKCEKGISLTENSRRKVEGNFRVFRGEPIEVTCESDGAPEMLLKWSCKKTDLNGGFEEACKNLPGFHLSHVRLFLCIFIDDIKLVS